MPGTLWGPAWVSWRAGGGYVGWAPLAPRRMSIGSPLGSGSAWRFAMASDLGRRRGYMLPRQVAPRIFGRMTVVSNARALPIPGAKVRVNAGPTFAGMPPATATGAAGATRLAVVAPRALPRRVIEPHPGTPAAMLPWVRAAGRGERAVRWPARRRCRRRRTRGPACRATPLPAQRGPVAAAGLPFGRGAGQSARADDPWRALGDDLAGLARLPRPDRPGVAGDGTAPLGRGRPPVSPRPATPPVPPSAAGAHSATATRSEAAGARHSAAAADAIVRRRRSLVGWRRRTLVVRRRRWWPPALIGATALSRRSRPGGPSGTTPSA